MPRDVDSLGTDHGCWRVLAPSRDEVPDAFARVSSAPGEHDGWLARVQRLRGRAYLADGAIASDTVDASARHRQAGDEARWHVVSLDEAGELAACLWVRVWPRGVRYESLGVASAALARVPGPRAILRRAVERILAEADARGLAFAEIGGWAVAARARGAGAGARIVLGTYRLTQLLGGCLGVCTATTRHDAAARLGVLGVRPLALDRAELPPYHDPQYGCVMRVLRFDTSVVEPAIQTQIDLVGASLTDAPVLCRPSLRRRRSVSHTALRRYVPPAPDLRAALDARGRAVGR